MRLLNAAAWIDLTKLVIFMVVTALATGVLVVMIGNLTFEKTHPYKAVFADVTGLVKGDDIRVAGVKVGAVKDIKIIERDKAEVAFTMHQETPLKTDAIATIRYRNLIGQRYIALAPGSDAAEVIPPKGTLPISQTQPALDLTVLFNGFKPLFAALSPAEINQLSYEIIQVFQGEGANIENLLASTGSVTQTLANRDQLVGDVIENLNHVLVTLGNRDRQLSDTIMQFRAFLAGLVDDKDAILSSLDSISVLAEETAGLATDIRPDLVADVKQIRKLAANLNHKRDELDRVLQIFPIKLEKIGRTGIYGSFFNFFICEFKASVHLPPPIGVQDITYKTFPLGTGRCNL